MDWYWEKGQEKNIIEWLHSLNTMSEPEEDYLCNVRSGELCFDLIVREDELGEYKLFTDLYVSGIDTGYGQSETGKPYDFFGDIGYTFDIHDFRGMNLDQFKTFISEKLTSEILSKKTGADFWGKEHDLIEKAVKPLIIW